MTDTREGRGKLYVVGTPIGNVDDLSPRARDVLAKADVIAAEDTRHTRGLLSRIGVDQRLIAYHEHNEAERVARLPRAARARPIRGARERCRHTADQRSRLAARERRASSRHRRDSRAGSMRGHRSALRCRFADGSLRVRRILAAARKRASRTPRVVAPRAAHDGLLRSRASRRGNTRGAAARVRRRTPRSDRARAHEDSRADRDGQAWPSSKHPSTPASRCSASS